MNIAVKRFIEQETNTQTYLVTNHLNSCLIIDSVLSECQKYLDYINSNNLKLVYILDTHIHADHITGSSYLKQLTGAKIAMGIEAVSVSPRLDQYLDIKFTDGQEINFDKIAIKAISTPGHTIESYSYLIQDKLFTGDTLLINACGRTDFQNGSSKDLYNSLYNKLLCLSDDTLVYPGHDYKGRTVSTILEEKINNPRLQANTQQEFAEIMDNLNLPRPKYIDIAVPRNILCGDEV